MRRVGAGMDVAAQQVRNKLPGHEASTYSKPSKPHLTLVDLPDRSVLFKPPGWEVYGGHVESQLSDFVKASFGNAPIFYDVQHNFGFLHRLDVPSSGLILVAKTYEAFYDMQVQLHAGEMHRDYTVLCHGRLPARWCRSPQGFNPQRMGQLLLEEGSAAFQRSRPSSHTFSIL